MIWQNILFSFCFCVIAVIERPKRINFYAMCIEIFHITFPTIFFHVISYLPSFIPSFLPSVFLSFAFCGAPACFQAMASLCNISLPSSRN
jgi:hypothetical protein